MVWNFQEALRLQQTVVDIWSLKEKYHLAAAVAHSGNGVRGLYDFFVPT